MFDTIRAKRGDVRRLAHRYHGRFARDETKPSAYYADGRIFVSLPHGINLSFPISGNWRLEDATPEQRNVMELDEDGIHWPAIDEDLSYEGLLMGDYGQFVRRPAVLQSVKSE